MKTSKNIFKSLQIKVLLVLLISLISIPVLYQFNWSGFGEDSNKSKSIETTIKDGKIISIKKTETEYFQSGKTLWDWLGLAGTLAIPIVLFQFQTSEQRRSEKQASVEKEQAEKRETFEKYIAEANLREEAFQAYIDSMAVILINERSRSELFYNKNENNNEDNSVRDIARIRTVTILRRLENDIERQNRILHFLHDAELLQFLLKTANLSGINLNGVNLNGVNLNGANFTNAILCGANFSEASLNGANFTNANLCGANLEKSYIQNTNFINTDLSNARLVNAKTWYEEEIDFNFFEVEVVDDELGPPYQREIFYTTDFSGAKLTNANLVSTNLKAAENLTVEQLKEAKNWDEAIYNTKLFKKLGLPKPLESIIDNMYKDAFRLNKDEDIDFEKLIGYQVEVRNYLDNETKTIIKGEITGFSKSNRRVNLKTSNGENLDKYLYQVYVYMTE
jgi:hypothetical protein